MSRKLDPTDMRKRVNEIQQQEIVAKLTKLDMEAESHYTSWQYHLKLSIIHKENYQKAMAEVLKLELEATHGK
jgi:hypothetical protein